MAETDRNCLRHALATSSGENPWGLTIAYSTLGLILVVDQLLLPMFRVGSVSFKPSYFILAFWLLHCFAFPRSHGHATNDIKNVFSVFLLVVGCIILGEMFLSTLYTVSSQYEFARGVLMFAFAALAFSLGRTAKPFNLHILVYLLCAALALNFAFIVFKTRLPAALINLYIPKGALIPNRVGFQSVEDILNLTRPRGAFGNPNTSMAMVNVIVLFIHLCLRHQLVRITSCLQAFIVIFGPVILAAALCSRGEFVVSCMLAILNYRAILHRRSIHFNLRFAGYTVLILTTVTALVIYQFRDLLGVIDTKRLSTIVNVSKLADSRDGEAKVDSLARPLIAADRAVSRFSLSPLFGLGISAADAPILAEGTQYFHNDWFFMLAVSGVIGFFAMSQLVIRFVRRLGWPVAIPFFLPGLVNTFVLTIPMFISYFFLVGLLLASIQRKTLEQEQLVSTL